MTPSKPEIMQNLEVNHLPSLPNVLVEMLRACEHNQASFQELSQIISRDSVIAGRVIFLANSSFYNPGSKITTLERALFLLGIDTLKTIVITASIQQFFSAFKSAHSEFLMGFWQRSLSCALLAKSLAILTSYPNPDEVYLAGLLHNIGELVLDSNKPGLYKANQKHTGEKLTDHESNNLEKATFSFTHAQVGACLAKEWGLSQFVCDAIEFHHSDLALIEDAHHLVKLVYLGSYLSHPSKQYLELSDDIAHRLFELNSALVNEIVKKIDSEVVAISKSLGLDFNLDPVAASEQHEHAQLKLAQKVRNISLIQNAMGELDRANNKQELSNALQNALSWLYGLNRSATFWFTQETNTLSFEHPDTSNSLPIKVKLEAHRSLIAQSALDETILNSLDIEQPLSIVDHQIINFLESDGLICIPIQDETGLVCVLVAGIHKDYVMHTHFKEFLSFFAHETTLVCRRSLNNLSNKGLAETHHADQDINIRLNEVVHEANNPLNIISNYLHSLGQKLSNEGEIDSDEIGKELNIVREEVYRAGQILLQLKDLKQEQIQSIAGVDINAEIEALCTIYKTSLFLEKNITFTLKLDAKLKSFVLNKNALKQILTNLIRNASEALPSNGNIVISTNAKTNINGQDFVELCIEDDGPGISEAILKNLFEPVVSTKGNGHSGLGLSITKNLVKDAKGTISCRSSDKGTKFQILFPHA